MEKLLGVENSFYKAELKNGEWKIKPKSYTPVKDDTKFIDLPRFKLITQYESELKNNYLDTLKSMMRTVTQKIDEIHSGANK